MQGVVAAGDRHTARAAAEVMRAGGNAVDAAVAGAFAAFVAEPLLASAGGAGMLTVAMPDGPAAVVDFFSPVPGRGPRPEKLDFEEVRINFGSAVQSFHIGHGSVAPPLALPGLVLASKRFGHLPLEALVAPAAAMARDGVELGREGALVFELLWPIQERSPEALALAGGARPVQGSTIRNPELAVLLEELAREGASPTWFDEAILRDFGPGAGGQLSREDLESAEPQITAPIELALGDWTALTSPRPGGASVARILSELFGSGAGADEAAEVVRVAEACRSARDTRAVLSARGSTTHVSAIDKDGGAASITLTNGEGCGYVARGTGVQLNNFLGEEDLNPGGFHLHDAGGALPTMIAPTIALRDGRPALVLGSGGSNRIRSIVSQVLARVVRGESLEAAVLAPRVHAEQDDAWVELSGRTDPDAIVRALQERFERVHPFPGPAFFFGGVHTAAVSPGGARQGVGDARRGGAVEYV